MRVKRYLVKEKQEAMALIRRDLGPDALIISSRRVRTGGLWRFFSPPLWEVMAAADSVDFSPAKEKQAPAVRTDEQLAKDLSEVKSLLQKLSRSGAGYVPNGQQVLARGMEQLQEVEVSPEVAEVLLTGAAGSTGPNKAGEKELHELLLSGIVDILVSPTAANKHYNLLAFVGPTGVGKTTTLAKLAAHFALFQQKNVGLVTIDTYRIGAVDQLRTYGEILGVPVEVVMTPKEFKKKVDDLRREKDIVLIDTTGRPSHNTMDLAELRRFLEKVVPLETFLVLSCTTKSKDLLRIAENFKILNYTQLIFTKTDETQTLGSILNVVHTMQVPVAYLTNGQNVPNDIMTVKPHELAQMILGMVE